MQGRVLSLGLSVLLAGGPAGAGAKDWGRLRAALAAIPTVTGESAFARMAACRMRIQRTNSFVETLPRDLPSQGARAGDQMVDVLFVLPKPSGGSEPDIVARWVIHNGKATPQSGWAEKIQRQPAPLDWMPC